MSTLLSGTQPGIQPQFSSGLTARVISSHGEMEQLRGVWEELNWNPNAQIDFYRLINETREGILKPYIVLIEHVGQPIGILVGRIVNQMFRCRIGYKVVKLGKVRELSVVYGGVLGCSDERLAEVALAQLKHLLETREVDLVLLSHLDTTSPLFGLAERSLGILRRDHFVASQPHWRTTLPGSWDELLKRLNKKHRYWLRRLERLIEEDFQGQVRFRSFADGSQLSEMLDEMEFIASKTYQRQLGAGFINNVEYARRLGLEAEKGWLRGFILYIKDKPCAFWLGTLYKGVYHSGFTGFDPEFRKYEPGTIAFMKMVQHLCQEKAAAIDYGLGDALYKQRFGDASWREASLRLFAPSMRGIGLNVTQTAIEGPALLAKSLLKRIKLQQRIKTLWRRRLAGSNED